MVVGATAVCRGSSVISLLATNGSIFIAGMLMVALSGGFLLASEFTSKNKSFGTTVRIQTPPQTDALPFHSPSCHAGRALERLRLHRRPGCRNGLGRQEPRSLGLGLALPGWRHTLTQPYLYDPLPLLPPASWSDALERDAVEKNSSIETAIVRRRVRVSSLPAAIRPHPKLSSLLPTRQGFAYLSFYLTNAKLLESVQSPSAPGACCRCALGPHFPAFRASDECALALFHPKAAEPVPTTPAKSRSTPAKSTSASRKSSKREEPEEAEDSEAPSESHDLEGETSEVDTQDD